MNAPTSIPVTPVFVADLLAEGERMPVYIHVIDHPDGRVLVDTGIKELHPAVADMDPRLRFSWAWRSAHGWMKLCVLSADVARSWCRRVRASD